jgi:UDP-hydrolysing UDP-N-acetyl-D-glucosamine 2-epimerase
MVKIVRNPKSPHPNLHQFGYARCGPEGTRRRVCYVTGTRAEFGLMKPVLRAIRAHPKLELQLVVTGMHLDRSRGYSADEIRREGWLDDIEHSLLPWQPAGEDPWVISTATGRAIAAISSTLERFHTDVVLVCGDRVEAFAAASSGHISARVVAHVHGGDRALGQVDDSLRHSITKLSHIHFPATEDSARRIKRLGEDSRRIHVVGAPGIDGIVRDATPLHDLKLPVRSRLYALLVLHPADPDDALEESRAKLVLGALETLDFEKIVIVYPNTDPGAAGIVRCWKSRAKSDRLIVREDLPRPVFLGLLKHAAVLVGNSSAGIIEAASFGTPVIDIGRRQLGRLRSQNVMNVPYSEAQIVRQLIRMRRKGFPRWRGRNVYGGQGTGRRVASILARLKPDISLTRKLIAY